MKNKLILFLLLLATACDNKSHTRINTQAETIPNVSEEKSATSVVDTNNEVQTFLIQVGQVGNIRKGMATHELYHLFDSTQIQKKKEKQGGFTYAIYQDAINPDIICTSLHGEAIDAVIIQSTAYKTEKRIGVGNTFGELTEVYHIAQVKADSGQQIFIQVEELQRKQSGQYGEEITGVLFEIGFDASGLVQENGSVSPSAIPPNAKIVRIFL